MLAAAAVEAPEAPPFERKPNPRDALDAALLTLHAAEATKEGTHIARQRARQQIANALARHACFADVNQLAARYRAEMIRRDRPGEQLPDNLIHKAEQLAEADKQLREYEGAEEMIEAEDKAAEQVLE